MTSPLQVKQSCCIKSFESPSKSQRYEGKIGILSLNIFNRWSPVNSDEDVTRTSTNLLSTSSETLSSTAQISPRTAGNGTSSWSSWSEEESLSSQSPQVSPCLSDKRSPVDKQQPEATIANQRSQTFPLLPRDMNNTKRQHTLTNNQLSKNKFVVLHPLTIQFLKEPYGPLYDQLQRKDQTSFENIEKWLSFDKAISCVRHQDNIERSSIEDAECSSNLLFEEHESYCSLSRTNQSNNNFCTELSSANESNFSRNASSFKSDNSFIMNRLNFNSDRDRILESQESLGLVENSSTRESDEEFEETTFDSERPSISLHQTRNMLQNKTSIVRFSSIDSSNSLEKDSSFNQQTFQVENNLCSLCHQPFPLNSKEKLNLIPVYQSEKHQIHKNSSSSGYKSVETLDNRNHRNRSSVDRNSSNQWSENAARLTKHKNDQSFPTSPKRKLSAQQKGYRHHSVILQDQFSEQTFNKMCPRNCKPYMVRENYTESLQKHCHKFNGVIGDGSNTDLNNSFDSAFSEEMQRNITVPNRKNDDYRETYEYQKLHNYNNLKNNYLINNHLPSNENIAEPESTKILSDTIDRQSSYYRLFNLSQTALKQRANRKCQLLSTDSILQSPPYSPIRERRSHKRSVSNKTGSEILSKHRTISDRLEGDKYWKRQVGSPHRERHLDNSRSHDKLPSCARINKFRINSVGGCNYEEETPNGNELGSNDCEMKKLALHESVSTKEPSIRKSVSMSAVPEATKTAVLPKLQVCKRSGNWWALNAGVLQLYRDLYYKAKCNQVIAEVVQLSKVSDIDLKCIFKVSDIDFK